MMIWVDTDFGFDDLWAILLLRHYRIELAGVSLVAGNVPLPQVKANALGANQAYGLAMPLFEGADRPLVRAPETAQTILGQSGMQTRGKTLPVVPTNQPLPAAEEALTRWLMATSEDQAHQILAIGPLTNIAKLVQTRPEATDRISRLVWMGGGNGKGNHTPYAEFNAFADPEAADIVMRAGIPMDIVDLTLCRTVTFASNEIPPCDPLTTDLLGGYFDIALRNGKDRMSIYDPVAALAIIKPNQFYGKIVAATTVTEQGALYGATNFAPVPDGNQRLLLKAPIDATASCLDALKGL